jgi:hypothetical protein
MNNFRWLYLALQDIDLQNDAAAKNYTIKLLFTSIAVISTALKMA